MPVRVRPARRSARPPLPRRRSTCRGWSCPSWSPPTGAIRALNRTWRRKDRPTDVLSFPAGDPLPGSTGPRPLGDVILSLDTARRAGPRPPARRSAGAELDLYLAHGLLHLLGHDHHRPADARRMAALEARLLGGPGMVHGALGRSLKLRAGSPVSVPLLLGAFATDGRGRPPTHQPLRLRTPRRAPSARAAAPDLPAAGAPAPLGSPRRGDLPPGLPGGAPPASCSPPASSSRWPSSASSRSSSPSASCRPGAPSPPASWRGWSSSPAPSGG